MNNKILWIVRGLPGSGKSTIAGKIAESYDADHHETDQWFIVEGEYVWRPKFLKHAHHWCQEMVRESMMNGRPVVVANTFTQLWEMEKYFDMAEDYGYTPVVIECTGEYQNVHGVPDEVIQKMKDRWEKLEDETQKFSTKELEEIQQISHNG